METVQIVEYKDRVPDNLSGGQQQRVALARAVVIEPSVLLMDEPLSNLDAKLRVDMQNAIKEIQNEIDITTIYVTHDQEEAMAASDRIAVMKRGVIQHVGTPQEIYHRPNNTLVATFIGHSNILEGELLLEGTPQVRLGNYTTELSTINSQKVKDMPSKEKVKLSVRPEEFVISDTPTELKATIISSMFLGLNTHYFVELETGDKVEIVKESSMEHTPKKVSTLYLDIKKEKINVFSFDGEENLTKGVLTMTKRKKDVWFYISIAIFLMYVLFLISPLFILLGKSVYSAETGRFTLENFKRFFGRKYYYSGILNSMKVT